MTLNFMARKKDYSKLSKDELRNEMNALEGDKVLYCFSVDPQGLVKDDFGDWDNIRLEPIPQKILDIYKQLFDGK